MNESPEVDRHLELMTRAHRLCEEAKQLRIISQQLSKQNQRLREKCVELYRKSHPKLYSDKQSG